MNANLRPGRLTAVATAVAALTTAGFAVAAAPAVASSGPTVTLLNGTVTVTGTSARDLVGISVNSSRLVVDFGLDGTIDAHFGRAHFRQVQVFAGDGDDGVRVTGAGDVAVTINGGPGNDGIGVVGNIGTTGVGDAPTTINGGSGNDRLFAATPGPLTVHAGTGDDSVDGGGAGIGREAISLGDGNDRFTSALSTFVGTRSDFVDGGAGHNTLVANGTFASETVALSGDAGHLIVTDDRAQIDANNIQSVKWFGFGGLDGGDTVRVNDLSLTDVTRVTPNFSAPSDPAAPNNSEDDLTVRGTAADDHITVSGSGANITVTGLGPTVTPVLLDHQDTLRIDTVDGKATVDTAGLQPGLVQLQVI